MGCDRRPRNGEESRRAAAAAAVEVPSYFKCPISLCLMADPVSICTGITYDRSSIEKWLEEGRGTCPVTMQPLATQDLIPNHTLRRIIQAWCSSNSQSEPESAPPTKPASGRIDSREAEQLVSDIRLGGAGVGAALSRMSEKAREGTKSRERLAAAGAAAPLAALLGSSSDEEQQQEAVVLLSQLGLDAAARESIVRGALPTVSWLLQRGPISTRIAAAAVLEDLSSASREARLAIGSEAGVFEGLGRLLREDGRHQAAVRAALRAVLAICAPMKNRIRLVESGVMAPLVELLPDSDRIVTESVLAVLECLCGCAEGRAAVARHALAVPAVTKKLFKVSDMATEYAIDVLWAVCKYCPDEGVRRRMVEVGLFPKLFFFLQIGCNPRTKHKAGDLLKLLHRAYRDCCIEESNNKNNTCLLSA